MLELRRYRSCIHRNGRSTTLDCYDYAVGEDKEHQWKGRWKLYLLDFIYPYRTASSCSLLLLRVAG